MIICKMRTVMLAIIILVSFTLTSCNNKDLKNQLDQDCKYDINYLYYPCDEKGIGSKSVNIYFSDKIDKYRFSKADLLQDDKVIVSGIELDINSIKDNMITISINDYISSFNQIRLSSTDKKNDMVLYTGQFYFEKTLLYEEIEDTYRSTLSKAHTTIKNNYFKNEMEFTVPVPSKIYNIVPDLLQNSGIGFNQECKKISENDNVVKYDYSCNIPIEYFNSNNYKNVTFEVMWIQEDSVTKKRNYIYIEYIPLSPTLE